MRAFLFLGTFSLLLTGCAQRFDDLEEKLDTVHKRTVALEAKTGAPLASDRELLAGQKLADIRSQVAAMRNDITVLNGRAEALEFENKNLNARIDQLQQEIKQSKAPKEEKAKDSEKTSESAPAASDPETEYTKALHAHQDGDYAKAEQLFNAFLKKYPKNSLAPSALYWMGDGYVQQKAYKKAITKFQDLIERFPKSDKRCDAMNQQILALTELGMKKEAKAFAQVQKSECPK